MNYSNSRIDGLRGLFALLVVIGHSYDVADVKVIGDTLYAIMTRTRPLLGFTWVVGFVVLSGFCIELSCKKSRPEDFSLKKFWELRATRLLPVLVVSAALAAVVEWIMFGSPARPPIWAENININHLLINFAAAGGFFGRFGSLAPAYTLSFEILYYLLWSVSRKSLRSPVAAFAANVMFVAVFLFFSVQISQQLPAPIAAIFQTFIIIIYGSWLIGVAVANHLKSMLASKFVVGLARWGWVLLFACMLYALDDFQFLSFTKDVLPSVIYYNAIALCFALIVIDCYARKGSAAPNETNFKLGLLSYPLYLIHGPVIIFVGYLFNVFEIKVRFMVHFAVLVGCAVAVAWLVAWYVERPLLQYRKRALSGTDKVGSSTIRAKKSALFINYGLVLLSVGVALVIVEIGFRAGLALGLVKTITSVYSTQPGGYYFWSREGGSARGFNNRYGYADHDYEPTKKQGTQRIVILGDSFVEALQVAIDDKMGPQLQRRLDKHGLRYEVLSFGRSGEYPAFYLQRLKRVAQQFEPDVVVVAFYMGNDFRNASEEIEGLESGSTPDQYIFYKKSRSADGPRFVLSEKSERFADDMFERERHGVVVSSAWHGSVDHWLKENFILYTELPTRLAEISNRQVPKASVGGNELAEVEAFGRSAGDWRAGNDAGITQLAGGDAGIEVKNTRGNANGFVKHSLVVKPRRSYEISLELKMNDELSMPSVYIGQPGNVAAYAQYSPSAPGWETYRARFVAMSPEVDFMLQVGSDKAGASASFANFTIQELPMCNADSIFVRSMAACWNDAQAITSQLVREFRDYADMRGLRLVFVGIPPNEAFWSEDYAAAFASASFAPHVKLDYKAKLAAHFKAKSDDIDLARPQAMLREIMDANAVAYIDMTDDIGAKLKQGASGIFCQPLSGHLCEMGHKLVSDKLFALINSPPKR